MLNHCKKRFKDILKNFKYIYISQIETFFTNTFFCNPNTLVFITMSSRNSTFSKQERSQREVRWSGKLKFGSYDAYDAEVARRQEEREQIRGEIAAAAEANDGFIPVLSRNKGKKKFTNQQRAPNKEYEVCQIGYAVFKNTDDDECQNSEPEPIPEPTPEPMTNKRSYAEAMTPTLGGNNKREANLKKPTWFEMCDSDDED